MSYVANIFLFPISVIWDFVHRLRRLLYLYGPLTPRRFRVPIVSVGNLTFGGTGKTPFTLWLSKFLEAQGNKVMVLTRGHKGNLEHKSGIIEKNKKFPVGPETFGDEPVLLARRLETVPIVVGKRRAENLQYYFDQISPDVVVLDDGHQHIQLDRNFNIVLFDGLSNLESYKVAPMGQLRENLKAIDSANLVVINHAKKAGKEKVKKLIDKISPYLHEKAEILEIDYRPTGLFNFNFIPGPNLSDLQNKSVIVVSAIGAPHSFFQQVEFLGANIVEKFVFPDHYYYKSQDILQIIDKAQKEDAIIITTEKDIVKMRRVYQSELIFYLEIGVEFLDQTKKSAAENAILKGLKESL
jgi:tetraacyldisaccharide 4'-kinase